MMYGRSIDSGEPFSGYLAPSIYLFRLGPSIISCAHCTVLCVHSNVIDYTINIKRLRVIQHGHLPALPANQYVLLDKWQPHWISFQFCQLNCFLPAHFDWNYCHRTTFSRANFMNTGQTDGRTDGRTRAQVPFHTSAR